ncbi:MAG: Holliday junction branch migration protein RuvA, partial [Candidatus Micrarchaeota archaeon]|nr:Holliday junction branch migration protein RuvA [Candidatus Micrarchaeota archaeon]
ERIVLNLKDKLGLATTANAEQLNAETEILEVLQALGYSLNSARQALQNIDEKKNPDTPSRLKAALKYLGK